MQGSAASPTPRRRHPQGALDRSILGVHPRSVCRYLGAPRPATHRRDSNAIKGGGPSRGVVGNLILLPPRTPPQFFFPPDPRSASDATRCTPAACVGVPARTRTWDRRIRKPMQQRRKRRGACSLRRRHRGWIPLWIPYASKAALGHGIEGLRHAQRPRLPTREVGCIAVACLARRVGHGSHVTTHAFTLLPARGLRQQGLAEATLLALAGLGFCALSLAFRDLASPGFALEPGCRRRWGEGKRGPLEPSTRKARRPDGE